MTTKDQNVRYKMKQSKDFDKASGQEKDYLAAARAYVTKVNATEVKTKDQDVRYKTKQSKDFDKTSGEKKDCLECGLRPKLEALTVCGPCLKAMHELQG